MQYAKITRPSLATGKPYVRTVVIMRECTTYTGVEQGRPVWAANTYGGPEFLEVLSEEEEATIVNVGPETPAPAPAHKPGMDNGTGRCMTCDSRRCPTSGCMAREGYVWAPPVGWVSPERAAMLENGGETVYWDDVWHD
jgi:hypothetical protein